MCGNSNISFLVYFFIPELVEGLALGGGLSIDRAYP